VGQVNATADTTTPREDRDPPSDDELRVRARDVLAANWTGSFTVPSRKQYPHQWNWDSAFVSLGLPTERAWQDLRTLLAAQWADGRVPSIVFDPRTAADAYFPGPAIWQSRRAPGAPAVDTTGIVQPPLHALAALQVYRRAADREPARAALADLYPRLAAQHDYLARSRDLGGEGLVAILHP
jgi:mannosylglycerate hydrolase MGH1-like protein